MARMGLQWSLSNLFLTFFYMYQKKDGYITILVCVCILIFFILFAAFSIKVPAGYSAIKIDLYGDDKGTQVEALGTGRNFYNSITHDVVRYPVFIQQKEFENMEFQDIDGLKISANVGVSYKFKEEDVGKMYQTYRANADKITNEYMKTWLRDSVNSTASAYKVDVLYGEKKEDFRSNVQKVLTESLKDKGIHVDNVYFVGAFTLPKQVTSRIDAKIEATQKAIQAENELRAVQAEAQKKIAKAEGDAESKIKIAQGNAQSILIEAEAKAQANKKISQSVTSNLIEYEKINKWNGAMPQVTSGGGVLMNIK